MKNDFQELAASLCGHGVRLDFRYSQYESGKFGAECYVRRGNKYTAFNMTDIETAEEFWNDYLAEAIQAVLTKNEDQS